jgi:hypothetical protein
MGNKVKKSEHNGAKNGGGHWGDREEAKNHSRKLRRQIEKKLLQNAGAAAGLSETLGLPKSEGLDLKEK